MIAFAFIGPDGLPTGGGIQPVLPEFAVPLPAPFTTADLPRLRYRHGIWWERTDLAPPKPPSADEIVARRAFVLARTRTTAIARVNARVDAFRRHIGTAIAGQDVLYLAKRAEAVAYVALFPVASLRDFPLLTNEVGITAPDAWQVAQVWLHRSDRAAELTIATERARLTATYALAEAGDDTAITAIEQSFAEALQLLSL